MFVCRDFVLIPPPFGLFWGGVPPPLLAVVFSLGCVFFFFPLAAKLTGPQMGHQFFKNVERTRKSLITELAVVNGEIHDLARPKTAYVRERVVNRTIHLFEPSVPQYV